MVGDSCHFISCSFGGPWGVFPHLPFVVLDLKCHDSESRTPNAGPIDSMAYRMLVPDDCPFEESYGLPCSPVNLSHNRHSVSAEIKVYTNYITYLVL